MKFSTESKPYEQYAYDIDDALEALGGLRIYARDYGRLWRKDCWDLHQ